MILADEVYCVVFQALCRDYAFQTRLTLVVLQFARVVRCLIPRPPWTGLKPGFLALLRPDEEQPAP